MILNQNDTISKWQYYKWHILNDIFKWPILNDSFEMIILKMTLQWHAYNWQLNKCHCVQMTFYHSLIVEISFSSISLSVRPNRKKAIGCNVFGPNVVAPDWDPIHISDCFGSFGTTSFSRWTTLEFSQFDQSKIASRK